MHKEGFSLDREHIVNLLPHKYPFVMVDRVLEFKRGQWIKGVKHIERNTRIQWCNPHIMLCESLAQLSKILDVLSSNETITISYLTSLKVEFFNNVRISDNIELYAEMIQNYNSMYCFEVEAKMNSIPILTGSIYRKTQAL